MSGRTGCNAARQPASALQRVHERAIVVAVAGGLHDHVALETEEIAQGEELLLGRVARRVLPLRRVGKHGGRAEDVAVCVHGARRRRYRQAWTGWRGMTDNRRPYRNLSVSARTQRRRTACGPFAAATHFVPRQASSSPSARTVISPVGCSMLSTLVCALPPAGLLKMCAGCARYRPLGCLSRRVCALPPAGLLERRVCALPPAGLLERRVCALPPYGLLERRVCALPPSGLLERKFRPSGMRARAAAGAPSSMQAVATLTAPSTPMEAWQRWGNEGARRNGPAGGGRAHHAHLRHGLFSAHRPNSSSAGLQPDGFQPRLQLRVGFERLARLTARDAEIAGAHHHHRHAVIDQRRLDAVDNVYRPPGGRRAPQLEPAISLKVI